nr:MAG TPA: hypothetical protein [Bacteriophage sp.]
MVKLNNASRVSERPTCLTFVVTKCQRTLNESIRNIVFSSVKANVQLINAAVLPL